MTIPIKTTEAGYFKLYLQILNPILKLVDKEIEVLSVFLDVYQKNISNPKINQYLFSTQTLKSIREHLKMDVHSFNNYKYSLRKKKMFINNTINPVILKGITPNGINNQEITYKFIINTPIKQIQNSKQPSSTTNTVEHV